MGEASVSWVDNEQSDEKTIVIIEFLMSQIT